jgi:AP-3 complex subunit beta
VAIAIPDETEGCINSLINLMSNSNENIVAESVIVIRHLLQPNPNEYERIIKRLAIMLIEVKVPVARASIVWMIGEYYTIIPKIGPDALRMLAKSFIDEEDSVKIQILLLGAKLYLRRAKGAKLLFKYILNLARYDMNYDIRDRARLIRVIIFNPNENAPSLKLKCKELLLTKKLIPVFQSSQQDRSRFTLGTLSHLVNATVFGYAPLPEFPEKMDEENIERRKKNDLQNTQITIKLLDEEESVEDFLKTGEQSEEESVPKKTGWSSDENFYTDDEAGDDLIDVDEELEMEEEEVNEEVQENTKNIKTKVPVVEEKDDYENEYSEEEVEEEEEEEVEEIEEIIEEEEEEEVEEIEEEEEEEVVYEESDEEEKKNTKKLEIDTKKKLHEQNKKELNDFTNQMTPIKNESFDDEEEETESLKTTKYEILNTSKFVVEYQFTRKKSNNGNNLTVLLLHFSNTSEESISNIKLGEIHDERKFTFDEITELKSNEKKNIKVEIDFLLNLDPINFEILESEEKHDTKITPFAGELIIAVPLNKNEFFSEQSKLAGDTTIEEDVKDTISDTEIPNTITSILSVHDVLEDFKSGEFQYSSKTMEKNPKLVLFEIKHDEELNSSHIIISSSNLEFAHIFMKNLVSSLQKKIY